MRKRREKEKSQTQGWVDVIRGETQPHIEEDEQPLPATDIPEQTPPAGTMDVGWARPDRKLTRVDRLFDAYRPGWYIFGKEVRNVECWKCGKGYTTTLEMNRFCSPKCKDGFLDSAFGKLRRGDI